MWEDIDLDRGTIHIYRGIDRFRDQEKSTKTDQARRFSIEPELLPLLRAMHAEAGGMGRVVEEMPEGTNLSRRLREHLERAGITRTDLFASDKTRKQITFYDLRATGITWMAVRGDDPLKLKSRAGHTSFTTTEGYIRETEQVRDGFGDVFPGLPAELVNPLDESSTNRPAEQLGLDEDPEILNLSLVGHEGLEPSANGLRVGVRDQLDLCKIAQFFWCCSSVIEGHAGTEVDSEGLEDHRTTRTDRWGGAEGRRN